MMFIASPGGEGAWPSRTSCRTGCQAAGRWMDWLRYAEQQGKIS